MESTTEPEPEAEEDLQPKDPAEMPLDAPQDPVQPPEPAS
jgi:hypothetical protein